tara:strand:- start:689 stop:793 length:105 start_codon:yes stop_codon:yes gene_type:complete
MGLGINGEMNKLLEIIALPFLLIEGIYAWMRFRP